ncbi:hypothetical protein Tco_1096486 [Tanacetum coccineum]
MYVLWTGRVGRLALPVINVFASNKSSNLKGVVLDCLKILLIHHRSSFKCENARLGNGSTSWSVQAVQEMLSAVGVRMDVHIKSVTPLYDIVLARMIERITSNTSY